MSAIPIVPVSLDGLAAAVGAERSGLSGSAFKAPGSFAAMLTHGIADTESKIAHADKLARAFVINDSVPVHQVTFALEDARMSLELMMQVRSRIIESYQQLMTMQL